MKPLLLLAGLTLLAAPAHAETTHRTSVNHGGEAIALAYEPQVRIAFKQTGLNPRQTMPTCMWKATVSIKRIAAREPGQPIAALTRTVDQGSTLSGRKPGYCSSFASREPAELVGEKALHAQSLAAAERDGAKLPIELASLAALDPATGYAR